MEYTIKQLADLSGVTRRLSPAPQRGAGGQGAGGEAATRCSAQEQQHPHI